MSEKMNIAILLEDNRNIVMLSKSNEEVLSYERENAGSCGAAQKTEQLRYNLIAMMDYAGSGHPGGSLSVLEIMTSLYYDGFLKVDAKNPQGPDRDRFRSAG